MDGFMQTTLAQGERFVRESGDKAVIASITNSTRATFSLANRSCYYEGTLAQNPAYPKVPEEYTPVHVGEYLTRHLDSKPYMVQTLQVQPHSPGQDYMFIAQCNQRVTLTREEPADAGSDRDPEWVPYAENVQVFMDTTTRSYKEQNDGLIAQDITVIQIPSRYKVKKLDRIYLLREGVPIDEAQIYRVDSINEALTPLNEYVDHSGIDVLQVSEDKRTGGVNDGSDPPDGGDENEGGGFW